MTSVINFLNKVKFNVLGRLIAAGYRAPFIKGYLDIPSFPFYKNVNEGHICRLEKASLNYCGSNKTFDLVYFQLKKSLNDFVWICISPDFIEFKKEVDNLRNKELEAMLDSTESLDEMVIIGTPEEIKAIRSSSGKR